MYARRGRYDGYFGIWIVDRFVAGYTTNYSQSIPEHCHQLVTEVCVCEQLAQRHYSQELKVIDVVEDWQEDGAMM